MFRYQRYSLESFPLGVATNHSLVKCLFVAMATSSKQLQVVQVVVNWGVPPQDNMKGINPATQTLNPMMRGRHMVISSWLPGGTSDSLLDASMTKITHIELLPAALDQPNKGWFPPVVLTVRSFVPTPDTPYNQEMQSIIDRWEILFDQPQTVHSAFENRRNSVGSAPQVKPSPPSLS